MRINIFRMKLSFNRWSREARIYRFDKIKFNRQTDRILTEGTINPHRNHTLRTKIIQ